MDISVSRVDLAHIWSRYILYIHEIFNEYIKIFKMFFVSAQMFNLLTISVVCRKCKYVGLRMLLRLHVIAGHYALCPALKKYTLIVYHIKIMCPEHMGSQELEI